MSHGHGTGGGHGAGGGGGARGAGGAGGARGTGSGRANGAHAAATDRASHGSIRSYSVGFALSILLTAIPFALIMTGALAGTAAVVAIAICAVVQVGVHLVFFLHLNRSSEQRWNVIAFAYTVVVLAILVGASVWIMNHLAQNMMGN